MTAAAYPLVCPWEGAGDKTTRGHAISIEDIERKLKLAWQRTDEEVREAQFTEFYEATYNQALAFVRARAVGYCDPESIVGDAFALVWSELNEAGKLPGRAWLYTVLRNKLGDLYRRWERERNNPFEATATTDSPVEQVITNVDVRRVLRSLPEEARDTLLLTYWLDLPAPEVAEILGTSAGAVRVRLTRARAAFKQAYDQSHNPIEEVG
jgi:RNA polymerase sigma-70 factor (ECF subfamily)